jgi:hypothetical protein
MKFVMEATVEVAGKTATVGASLDLEAGVRLRTDQLEGLLDSVRDALVEQVQQLGGVAERAELPELDKAAEPVGPKPPMPPYQEMFAGDWPRITPEDALPLLTHFGINVEDVELAKARFVEENAGKPYWQTYGPMEQDLAGQAVRWVPPSVFAAAVVEHPGLESPAGERCVVCDGRGRLIGSFGHAPKCAHCNGEGSLVAMPITGPGGTPWVKPAPETLGKAWVRCDVPHCSGTIRVTANEGESEAAAIARVRDLAHRMEGWRIGAGYDLCATHNNDEGAAAAEERAGYEARCCGVCSAPIIQDRGCAAPTCPGRAADVNGAGE